MFGAVNSPSIQTATSTPGAGPEQLVDVWPILVRAGWFLVGFLVVVVVGWYVLGPLLVRAIHRRNRNNPTLQEAIRRYFRLLVLLVALVIGALLTGYGEFLSNSAIVVAAATLALGVGGQQVIGSLISGIVLVTDREFNIGNFIEWENGCGKVEAITLRVTRVRTPDGKLVTIPNTLLTGNPITRPYQGRYRVVERIGLSYDADLRAALRICEETATELEGILTRPAPTTYVDEFGENAVFVRVHYWLESQHPSDVLAARSRYARRIKATLEEADVTISPASEHELTGRIELDDSES